MLRRPVEDPIFFEFSEYAKHAFNSRNPASFRYDGIVYKPSEKLGGGVFGETWLCNSLDSSKSLALKREIAVRAGSYLEGSRFQQEAVLNKKIYGVGEMSGNPEDTTHPHYLIMCFIQGAVLGDVFHKIEMRSGSDREILRIWILLAAAVIDFHRHGLVHGDLHSGNAIVSPSHTLVSLIDFGYTQPMGKFRNDCNIPTAKQKKYPFRPPETFNNIRNPLVIANKNQDIWSAGYHLSKTIKFSTSSRHSLSEITSELMHVTPEKRLCLEVAICKIISTCFQDRIRVMPFLMTPEWIIIVAAIIKMRMKELFIAIEQPSEPTIRGNAASVLADKKVQYTLLEKLYSSLEDNKPSGSPLNPHSFLSELNAISFDDCAFLPGGESLKLVRNVVRSFFPPVTPVQHVSEAMLISPRVSRVSLMPRAHTPVSGFRSFVQRANTPPAGMRSKMPYQNVATPTLVQKPMKFA